MIRKTAVAGALLAVFVLAGPVQSQDHQTAPMMNRQSTAMGHMGPGMMEPDMYGYGMMGQIGPSMMGSQMMHHGMMAPQMMGWRPRGLGPIWLYGRPQPEPLGTDDVRTMLEQRLAWHGNPRLKLGDVKESDGNTILAEIVTKDGSLVQRLEVDRKTGWLIQAE